MLLVPNDWDFFRFGNDFRDVRSTCFLLKFSFTTCNCELSAL